MKLGISTGALRKIAGDDNFGSVLSIVAELPVSHVEILFARPKMLFSDIDSGVLKLLKKKKISLHGPFFQNEGFEAVKNDKSILDELERKGLQLCANHITVHPDLLVDIKDLKNRKIPFAIENVKSLPLQEVLDIIKSNSGLKLAFDPNHILDSSVLDEKIVPKVVEFHLNLKGVDIKGGQKPMIPSWVINDDVLVILETSFKTVSEIKEVLEILKKSLS